MVIKNLFVATFDPRETDEYMYPLKVWVYEAKLHP